MYMVGVCASGTIAHMEWQIYTMSLPQTLANISSVIYNTIFAAHANLYII